MKHEDIKETLTRFGVDWKTVDLVPFDAIGETCARKVRDANSELAKRNGLYFRPNYERGILIDSIISKSCDSYLEIGFGRGYSAMCAAYAFHKLNKPVDVTVVDPNIDEKFAKEIISKYSFAQSIQFFQCTSEVFWQHAKERPDSKWDLIYIDGDHRYEATKLDWENAKLHANKFVLFDDYHLPTKKERDIECARAIDEIDDEQYEKTLVYTDRRIFADDLKRTTLDYGQVLVEFAKVKQKYIEEGFIGRRYEYDSTKMDSDTWVPDRSAMH